jgi:hypothetical protein
MTKTFKKKPTASAWKVRPEPRQTEKKNQENRLDSTNSFRDATPKKIHRKGTEVNPTTRATGSAELPSAWWTEAVWLRSTKLGEAPGGPRLRGGTDAFQDQDHSNVPLGVCTRNVRISRARLTAPD